MRPGDDAFAEKGAFGYRGLLIFPQPTDAAGPVKIADLLEALSQLAEIDDRQSPGDDDDDAGGLRCPHCGSARTRPLAECRRHGVP